jgi:hypothetical protein
MDKKVFKYPALSMPQLAAGNTENQAECFKRSSSHRAMNAPKAIAISEPAMDTGCRNSYLSPGQCLNPARLPDKVCIYTTA